jgi:hypothetical protein
MPDSIKVQYIVVLYILEKPTIHSYNCTCTAKTNAMLRSLRPMPGRYPDSAILLFVQQRLRTLLPAVSGKILEQNLSDLCVFYVINQGLKGI